MGVESKTGYSALTDLSEGVALADELQESHRFVAGNRRTQPAQNSDRTAVVQTTTIDAGLMVEVLVLVARYSLVEVHIWSRPFHLPFEQLLVRMPLMAEDYLDVSDLDSG